MSLIVYFSNLFDMLAWPEHNLEALQDRERSCELEVLAFEHLLHVCISILENQLLNHSSISTLSAIDLLLMENVWG